MSDECKIVRWLTFPDVWTPTENIGQSATYTIDGDESIVCRWLTVPDAWSNPSSSATYTINGNEIKLISWKVTSDEWNPINLIFLSDLLIKPLRLYEKQHSEILISISVYDTTFNPVQYRLIIGDEEISSYSFDTNRYIPITKFSYGENIIDLQVDDSKVYSFKVYKENNYRISVNRTFTNIEGGYNTTAIDKSSDHALLFNKPNITPSQYRDKQYIPINNGMKKLMPS